MDRQPACGFCDGTGLWADQDGGDPDPCPLCGGTRSFAYTWDGDLRSAVALYPLGPLLFGGTLAAIGALLVAVIANRDLALHPPRGWERPAWIVGGGVIAVSWGLKLTILPN